MGAPVTVSPTNNTVSVNPGSSALQSRIIRYAEMIDLDSATTAVPVRATSPTYPLTNITMNTPLPCSPSSTARSDKLESVRGKTQNGRLVISRLKRPA